MDSQEQQKTQTVSVLNPYLLRLKCFLCQALNPNINDENNNLKKENNTTVKALNPISKLPLYTCPDCEAKIRLEEKETASNSTVTSQENEEESDRMIIVPDTSSEDNEEECWCQSCHSTEHESDIRQFWDDLSHIIKCVYRATDKQFSENQFSDDICKAKEYVKKLTDLNPQILFNKLETIVFDYVKEIRSQVLERFHTCSKTSHDVQLFISFLLDEYQVFIQAAGNVSIILAYLEEKHLNSFHLTWLLYNKHLYEKLIYMDRKIQHSMSTMIDLLQPSSEENADYSPAEYTQLLNRFLAFDEEMSEIACLYKDSQAKEQSAQKQPEPKKKKNKKKNKKKGAKSAGELPAQQGSNGSSIGSGNGGDDESSVSSFDDYLLEQDPSSSFYMQDEDEEEELRRLILGDEDPNEQILKDLNEHLLKGLMESCSPIARIQQEIYQSTFNNKQSNSTITIENQKWIEGIIQGIQAESKNANKEETKTNPKPMENPSSSSTTKKSKSSKSSHRRKESSSAGPSTPTTTTTTQLPKKSIPADLFLPRSVADLSAKIQSVSFTAGTFGSITSSNPNESSSSSSSSSASNCSTTTLTAAKTTTSTGQTRLSINLTRKPGAKSNEHGGQKIAEALFNELTGLNNEESFSQARKKENQQFKKSKPQQQQRSTINETLLNASSNPHSFFNSSAKADPNAAAASSSSSTAYNNLDQLLRNAASNTDVSEATLHSILSSFHSSSCLDSTSKHPISSKTQEKIQTLLAQQQQHFHHHQQKKNLASPNPSKHCEFCCCDYAEGRNCAAPTSLHLPASPGNGPITSCVTCMSLPGSTTTTSTSVMGTTITGTFNPRDVEMKERLKLKLTKKKVQNLTEQQQKKNPPATPKKQPVQNNQAKPKENFVEDKHDIDDLVRFIDGNESLPAAHQQSEHPPATNNQQESTSKKNKKKKEKQAKNNNNNNGENKNQKKANSNASAANSQQPSRSASSSSSSAKTTPLPTPQPLSKRKQKAKLKLEQQQKTASERIEEASAPSPPSAPAPSASQGTHTARTSVELPAENFDSPEEEVNWITISRKQSKHKPAPAAVPSLLATPVPPVLPPANSKQHRPPGNNQSKKTPNTIANPTFVQGKTTQVTAEPMATSNKQPAPPRLQSALKSHASHPPSKAEVSLPPPSLIQPSTHLWNNNLYESTSTTGTSSPATHPSTPLYPPTHTPPPPLSEGLPSSTYWEAKSYFPSSTSQATLLPAAIPGPVQRPTPSFSPAPGSVNPSTAASRCIQRPSPEPRSCSANALPFPLYSPMNYAVGSSTAGWNDAPVANAHESQWNYPQQPMGGASQVTDFPLYDPFHSGAGLTMPSTNGFPEHFGDLYGVPLDNDVNEMDALDKEIENFKKFCFESVPLETREKVQVNTDRCFVRQA